MKKKKIAKGDEWKPKFPICWDICLLYMPNRIGNREDILAIFEISFIAFFILFCNLAFVWPVLQKRKNRTGFLSFKFEFSYSMGVVRVSTNPECPHLKYFVSPIENR